jgi:hypothetical protein
MNMGGIHIALTGLAIDAGSRFYKHFVLTGLKTDESLNLIELTQVLMSPDG